MHNAWRQRQQHWQASTHELKHWSALGSLEAELLTTSPPGPTVSELMVRSVGSVDTPEVSPARTEMAIELVPALDTSSAALPAARGRGRQAYAAFGTSSGSGAGWAAGRGRQFQSLQYWHVYGCCGVWPHSHPAFPSSNHSPPPHQRHPCHCLSRSALGRLWCG